MHEYDWLTTTLSEKRPTQEHISMTWDPWQTNLERVVLVELLATKPLKNDVTK